MGSRTLHEGTNSTEPASRVFREGTNSAGPASRILREGTNSSGPASRAFRDGANSSGPASRTLDGTTSLSPASRVLPEGPSGAISRTPPEGPRTSRTQPHEVLHLGEADLVACVGPCLVVLSNLLSLEGVEAMGRGMAKIIQRHGSVSALSFVERQGGPNTTTEARDAIAEVVRRHTQNITGAAVICEGTGFRATAIRSVVTAIHMASRSSHSSKVFSEPEPGIRWLASTRSDGGIDVPQLLEATTQLRAKLQLQLARTALR